MWIISVGDSSGAFAYNPQSNSNIGLYTTLIGVIVIIVGAVAVLPFAWALRVDIAGYIGIPLTLIPLTVAFVRSVLYLRNL